MFCLKPIICLPLEIIAKRFSDWADGTYGISTQEIELAEACYAESQPRDLDDQENQKRLINLALGSRNLEKATALLFALGDKYGFTLETLLQLGIVHEAMDNYHEAIGYYARAVEIDENAAQIRYRLGMAYKGAKSFMRLLYNLSTSFEMVLKTPNFIIIWDRFMRKWAHSN